MNKMYILILISIFSITITKKYNSDYYNNVTNILNKFPKVDIDYIFSKPSFKNSQDVNNSSNPLTNPFQNIFYDYYRTSVPLYDEKMKCYVPLKKNISLHLDNEYENSTKIKNISKFLGKNFLKALKGKCEQYYVERWYYTLCPLLGGLQTLSYLKPQDDKKEKEKEKQEVNYLGYDLSDEYYNNNSVFLLNLDEESKKLFEKKYSNEISDIFEENLFDYNKENGKIIGIYNNIVKFFGDKVFDSNKFSNKNKLFQIEYKTVLKEKNIFSADILKVISDDLILINQTLNIIELMQIKQLNKIKILKQDKNKGFHKSFFNQSFFIYNEFVYSSLINLILCSNKNCFVTISNHDDEVYRIDTIIDTKFGVLENNVEKNIKTYEKEKYCLFYGDDKLYFFGKGDIEELTEDDNREYLILYGENLNIENSDEIILLYNGTTSEYNNVVFMNTLLGGFIRLTYYSRINATHYKVKMVNKEDMSVFDKQITLDEKYIIVKYNNKNKKEYKSKSTHKFFILGNDKNISLLNKSSIIEKKESQIISSKSKEKNNEENKFYSIQNNKEFTVTFELSSYNENIKESYIYLCFSDTNKCKQGDYEVLFDLKNKGIIINQVNNDTNKPIAFIANNINVGVLVYKYGIIYMNSTLYLNNYFSDGKNKGESEIILKYKINKEKFDINYMIINKQKSKNIFINDIKFYDKVSFYLFKNIYFYNQKYLLNDSTTFVDIFEKGDYCEPIKANRKVIINYSCDEEGIYDFKLMNVYEDKKNICIYNYYAKSRLLCNPNTMMKNYVKYSPVKTFCYLDN